RLARVGDHRVRERRVGRGRHVGIGDGDEVVMHGGPPGDMLTPAHSLPVRGAEATPRQGGRSVTAQPLIARLVSGGQTGVDRAALDAALEVGVPCGGWCPKGRKAEDGRIDDRYPLCETPSAAYSQRTRWNVRDSDGTLVLAWGEPTGGTLLTVKA